MFSKTNRLLLLILSVCCCLLLTGCAERIAFAQKNVRADAERVSVVLQSGETLLLDRITRLKSADFSGSTCYEELYLWAKAHPEVETHYTVSLPDGSVVDNTAKELRLILPEKVQETAALLEFLPALKTVELDGDGEPVPFEILAAFCAVRPDIHYKCQFTFNGTAYHTDQKSLSLPGLDHAGAIELASVLPAMQQLETADLGSESESPALTWEDLSALQAAGPDVCFAYSFMLFGKEFSTTDTVMDLNHIPMDDGGAAVRQAISCMPKLKYLDMDSCGVSNEDMAAIRDDFPEIEVVWRIWFGDAYSVRTDTEKILASRPSKGGNLTSANTQALKYCTKVKYLDVGHNVALDDISFVSCMPELEVAILAMGCWSDASALANCPKLEYLELQTSNLTDLTPLSGLTELRHLNICYLFHLTDISPLYSLTQLERLWIGCLDPVPQEQIDTMQQCAPDCVINTSTYDPTEGGWRYSGLNENTWQMIPVPRYKLLREQFGYREADFAFYWNDPKY